MKIKLIFRLESYYKETFLAPLFVVIDTILFVQIPFIVASLIDDGINVASQSHIYSIGIKLLVVTILMTIFGVLGAVFAARGATGFAKNLRQNLFYKVQNYSFFN